MMWWCQCHFNLYTTHIPSIFSVSYSLYLHAEQLQQRREDAHVVEQKDVVSWPVEHVHLCVTLIKNSWGGNEQE